MRVLLADDERLLADTVAAGLRKLAMAVDVCYDGEAAVERLSVNRYDVAVLDRDMPRPAGDDVCRWMVDAEAGYARPDPDRGRAAFATGSTVWVWAPTTT